MKTYIFFIGILPLLFACTDNVNIDEEKKDKDTPPPTEEKEVPKGYYPCKNNKAGDYPCNGYDLQSTLSLTVMKAESANDLWGWQDPSNKKEYAIIGLNNGTVFVDISNPRKPIYLGKLPTATTNATHRDIKVHKNHAFIVSEAWYHGVQIFDLTRLRNVTNPPKNFTADIHYTKDFGDDRAANGGWGNGGNAHNIFINEASNTAYILGTSSRSKAKKGSIFSSFSDWPMSVYAWSTEILTHSDLKRPSV